MPTPFSRSLLALVAAAVAWLAGAALAQAASAQSQVAVFPSPGTHYNLPGTQITFRGISAGSIGPVQVIGSSTGVHSGHIEADSDGQGGSFIPNSPFAPGETVAVNTHLNILGGRNGSYSFVIAHPGAPIAPAALPLVPAGGNGLQHFRSRPDLTPVSITVTKHSEPGGPGRIFVAPQFGPAQDGPMILDSQGRMLWFQPYPVSSKTLVTDFRVQNLHGQQVLTWWQGSTNHGSGRGEGIIFDRSYHRIGVVHAGNGLDMDLHEFMITPQGQAYTIEVSPINLPGVGKPTMDAVVQEIDIKTGLVLFEWHALDHVALSESYFTPRSPGFIFDPYHANSVAVDRDGNLVVSMRDTSAEYKVDHRSGAIIWRLGGKRSSFRMGRGTSTWGQHDAVVQPDGTITIFDDGAGPPRVHKFSRAIRVRVDTRHRTATLVKEYDHAPGISSNFEGSAQMLPGGDVFMGWGQQPYFSEDTAGGSQDFDAHFTVPSGSYRAYRFHWNAQPPTTPAVAIASGGDGSTLLYASWNGATDVSSWRVLGGPTTHSLAPVGSSRWRGFETRIAVHSASPFFAVQAIGSKGQVLATSPTLATPTHIAVYGRSVFVPSAGLGGVPASCFLRTACKISLTVSAGRTVIARTGRESLGAGSGGLLYFALSGTGRSMLSHARGHRLVVQVTAQDVSGASASSTVTLVPFSTSGAGPHRAASGSAELQLVGSTEFVSSSGVGGVLAECLSQSPCHVNATVSVGSTVIARTGREFLGANELGYVIFSLTSAGQSMLAHAAGNQLGAHVVLGGGGSQGASGDVALVRFS